MSGTIILNKGITCTSKLQHGFALFHYITLATILSLFKFFALIYTDKRGLYLVNNIRRNFRILQLLNQLFNLFVNGKGTLNAMYVLEYPALENKHFDTSLFKIGYEIRNTLYFIFYITMSVSATILII